MSFLRRKRDSSKAGIFGARGTAIPNDSFKSHKVKFGAGGQLEFRLEENTLTWSEPPADQKSLLPKLSAGSCNLYLFPRVTTDGPSALAPSALAPPETVAILTEALVWLAKHSSVMEMTDGVGAYPVHALMVANTEASLSAAFAIFEAVPALLKLTHALSSTSASHVFAGESSLHVACANKAEEVLVRLVRLAVERLSHEEAEALLRAQTTGSFFGDLPMRLYGGTALSYACCFGLQAAVLALLETGLVSLNDRRDVCDRTGFLPLHAVVANCEASMYDFITSELPPEWRATLQVTARGRMTSVQMATGGSPNLGPLQLATRFGHHEMARHILGKQCEVMWVWGPITQFSLDLSGIDTAEYHSVLEVIVRRGAYKRTTQMVLDSFMNGFLHQLYNEKWRLYGRTLHWVRLALDTCLLVSLTVQTFALKAWPWTVHMYRPQSVAHLALIAITVLQECRIFWLYASHEIGKGDARLQLLSLVQRVWAFCVQHGVHVLLLSHAFTCVGSLLILSDALPEYACATVSDTWYSSLYEDDANATGCAAASAGRRLSGGSDDTLGEGRQLRTRSGISATGLDEWLEEYPITDEGLWALLWLCNALGLFLLAFYLAFSVSRPYEKLNILLNTILSVFLRDFATFITAFAFVLSGFYLALFASYPRSGDHVLPHASVFNEWHASLLDLLNLALLAEKVSITLLPDSFAVLSGWQLGSLAVWLLLYYLFLVVSCILMLNLLIAMLSHSFDKALGEATLESRLSFATDVMKLELVATSLGMKTRVGERTPSGTHVYRFRSSEGAQDGDAHGDAEEDKLMVATNPFAPPPPSQLSSVHDLIRSVDSRLARIEAKEAKAAWEFAGRSAVRHFSRAFHPRHSPEQSAVAAAGVANGRRGSVRGYLKERLAPGASSAEVAESPSLADLPPPVACAPHGAPTEATPRVARV